jgi:hypothetical protein
MYRGPLPFIESAPINFCRNEYLTLQKKARKLLALTQVAESMSSSS